MKACRKCGETKHAGDFHRHPTNRDGLMASCKACERARALAHYHANRDAYLEMTRTPEWRLKRKLRSLG